MHLPLNPSKIPIIVEQAINLQYKRIWREISENLLPLRNPVIRNTQQQLKNKITKPHGIG